MLDNFFEYSRFLRRVIRELDAFRYKYFDNWIFDNSSLRLFDGAFVKCRHRLNFTNSAQDVNFQKLCRFMNENIFENEQKRSSFLELTYRAELVKLNDRFCFK